MPLTLADFWKRCLASGLIDASTPRQWAASYAEDHNSTSPTDPSKLAKWLVATKRLLPFQASSLVYSSPEFADPADQNSLPRIPKLRIAPITQARDEPPEAFPGWLAVSRDVTDGGSGAAAKRAKSGILWQVDPRRITPEDGDRLRQLASIDTPGIPQFELIALPGGPLGSRMVSIAVNQEIDCVALFAGLPAGQMLGDALKAKRKWPIDRIVSLIQSIAGPLNKSSLTALTPTPALTVDHVWLSDSGASMLCIDPLEHLSPSISDSATTLRQTESRLLYAAPELIQAAPQEPANVSLTDERSTVYALGCLAYRLHTGNHAFSAAKDEQIRSRQINFNPPELIEAIEKGAEGDPFLRVLAYALNKDPGGRFATTESLLAALNATVPAVSSDPKKSQPDVKPSAAATQREAKPSKPAKKERPASDRPAPSPMTRQDQPIRSNRAKDQSVPAKPPAETPTIAAAPVAEPVAASPVSAPTVDESAAVPPSAPALHDSVESPSDDSVEAAFVAAASISASVPNAEPSVGEGFVTPVSRRKPSRRRNTWFILHSLWIPIFLLIVLNALYEPSSDPPVAKRIRPAIPTVIPSVSSSRPETANSKPRPKPVQNSTQESSDKVKNESIEVVDNDAMLWAPPSTQGDGGQPNAAPGRRTFPATVLLPPGPAAVVTIDYPNLIATGLRDTFDPEIAPVLSALTKRIGVSLDDVRLIAMAWFPGVDGIPSVAVAVHLTEPKPASELSKLWGASEAMGKGGVKLFASDDPDGFAYYPSTLSTNPLFESSEKDLVSAFAVGTIDQITDVAEVEGAPVLLPRQLEELWTHAEPTDAIAFLTQPNFLVADARGWVEGLAPPLLDWVRTALIPECGGLLLRVAATDNRSSYVEARLASAPGMNPTALRKKIANRLNNAPNSADDFLVTRDVDPSWRLLASRLPTMWAFASDQTRSMLIDRDVIFNTYLPPMALPQLTLATLLASNTNTTTVSGNVAKIEKLTLEQMLDRPMSITFGQESLQFAVDNIMSEFNDDLPKGNRLPLVEIVGGDLQLNGITQNQQIRDFKKTDVPLRTVLTDLVLGANPDKTATGPDDPKQSLVWVVFGDGSETKILITTRDASKEKYELPREFKLK